MSGAWAIQRATRKSGWIDTIWSGAVGLVSICVAAAATGGQRRFLVLALVLVWSSRLALHIARRTRGGGDDPRYAQMMRDWGDAGPRKLFAFLQWQALAGWTLVLAVALASNSPAPFPGIGDWFGCVLAIAGIAIEAVADALERLPEIDYLVIVAGGRRRDAHRPGGNDGRHGMLVDHLADRVFQQDDELIERLDLTLKLHAVHKVDGYRHPVLAQRVQKRVL